MSDILNAYYRKCITKEISRAKDYKRFHKKLRQTRLTRDTDPVSHCCAMTIAYESRTKKVLVVNHKKAQSWIFPGGHLDPGELPQEAAMREAEEEIGLSRKDMTLLGPISAQVLDITNPDQPCKEHYDIFYALATHPTAVSVNMNEFLGYEWLSIAAAKERIEMNYYKHALDTFVSFMKW